MTDQITLPRRTLDRLTELLVPLTAEVYYPESDGEPMAETDTHRDQMADGLIYPLKERYRERADVYVSGNTLLYYEEGNPQACVSPDVFIVFGIPARPRRTYRLWEEGRAPDVVFELTSTGTRHKDLREKRLLYEELGVREYFLFDPLREYLRPPLQGFRLENGFFVSLRPAPLPDGEWQLESETLGLTLHTDGSALRLYDPASGQYLRLHGEEAEGRRQEAEGRRQEAEGRRQEAEGRRQEAEGRRQEAE
ncbi:MAG: Uma2 family endonuclease, partial [Chloroflexi bacterium]|nr:Uma2 family endonuclease [Chloroflexota bacterium]